jgi:hypothetical protein
MRRLRRTLLTALVVCVTAGLCFAATPEQCGDADLSGTRTVTDGVLILRTAAELNGGCSVASRCDVDGNGQITVTDGVAALRLAAELSTPTDCRDVVDDHFPFTLFVFDRRSAFGFCPPLDSVSHVVLSSGAGGVTRSAKVFKAGTPGDPNCLTEEIMPVPAAECVLEVTLPDRLLTTDEVARVDAAFSAVAREQQRHPDCARVTFDPCLIDEFTWDGATITDFECGEPRLTLDESAELIAVLDSLQ